MSIHDILNSTTEGLKRALQAMPGVIKGKDYLLLPGTAQSPFMLVSHIDTLPRKKVELIHSKNIIRNRFGILGADDRAGVYAMLEVRQRATVKPWLLFTDKEEIGGIGAKEAARKLPCPDNIRLLLEFDRQGATEYVCYDEQPKAIHKYIKSFGFTEGFGSYSDISELCPAWKIPAVNLSIGYYHQHTSKECLHVDEMQLTIERVLKMIKEPIGKRHAMPERSWGHFQDDFQDFRSPQHCCEYCGMPSNKLYDLDFLKVCEDCYEYAALMR